MSQRPGRPAADVDAGLLRQEVVGVAPAPAVGEEEAPPGRLVEVEPRHVARTDTLVLHLTALI